MAGKFAEELEVKFTPDDFTGHLGVLLQADFSKSNESVKGALAFVQELYDVAKKHL